MQIKIGKDYWDSKRKQRVTVIDGIEPIYTVSRVSGTSYDVYYTDLEELSGTSKEVHPVEQKYGYELKSNPRPRKTDSVVNYASDVNSQVGYTSTLNQNKINERESGLKMNIKKLFGEFGKVSEGTVALTFDGKVAVARKDGDYVRYDAEKDQIVNSMSLVMGKVSKFFYILPVTSVQAGDIIKFKETFYQVLEVAENGSLKAVNLSQGTKSTICKETNAFGFNFYYKVTSLFKVDGSAQEGFNPLLLTLITDKGDSKYEDLLPLMLLGGQGGENEFTKNPLLLMSLIGDGKSDIKDLMMMQAFTGGNAGSTDFFSNPLLLMSLVDGGSSDLKDIMMLQAFSGNNAGASGQFNPLMLMLLNK